MTARVASRVSADTPMVPTIDCTCLRQQPVAMGGNVANKYQNFEEDYACSDDQLAVINED